MNDIHRLIKRIKQSHKRGMLRAAAIGLIVALPVDLTFGFLANWNRNMIINLALKLTAITALLIWRSRIHTEDK